MSYFDSTTVQTLTCPYCGSYLHQGMCPRIEEIEYYKNGTIKRLKLRPKHDSPSSIPDTSVTLTDPGYLPDTENT